MSKARHLQSLFAVLIIVALVATFQQREEQPEPSATSASPRKTVESSPRPNLLIRPEINHLTMSGREFDSLVFHYQVSENNIHTWYESENTDTPLTDLTVHSDKKSWRFRSNVPRKLGGDRKLPSAKMFKLALAALKLDEKKSDSRADLQDYLSDSEEIEMSIRIRGYTKKHSRTGKPAQVSCFARLVLKRTPEGLVLESWEPWRP